MKGWPMVPLSELSAEVPHACIGGPFGSELTTKDYVDSPGIPVIRGSNLIQSGFVEDGFVYVTEKKARALTANLACSGDIVFTQRGTIGQIAIIPEKTMHDRYLLSQSQMKLTPNLARLEPRFLVHYFRSPQAVRFLSQNTLATGVPHINLTILRRFPVPLPSLREQRRIAAILDKADALRAMRRAAIAKLDTLAQSIFLDMFGDPVTNPMGWAEPAVLGEVAEVVSGVTIGRRLNGKPTRVVPYLAVSNVQDRFLDMSIVKVTDATDDEIERYRLRRDDLVLTEGGDPDKLGRGTLWADQLPESIHQNHVFRVRLTSEIVTPIFLSWLVGSQRGKRYFFRSAKQTTGIASINMTQLRGFPLLAPPLPLQRSFARRVAAVSEWMATQRAVLSRLDALFASLQHRAFRGEL